MLKKGKKLSRVFVFLFLFSTLRIMSFKISAKAEEIPILYAESYEIVKGDLMPGEEATVQVVIKNSSDEIAAENVIVTYNSSNMALYPILGETNQIYLGSIPANEQKTVDLHLRVIENIAEEKVDLTIRMDGNYSSEKSLQTTSNATILSLPLTQASVLSINNLSIAEKSVLGAKTLVSFSIQNDGMDKLYNVVFHVDGEIEESQKELKIGEVVANDVKYLDTYVNFLNKGIKQVRCWFTYTDENGTEYRKEAGTYEIIVSEEENKNEKGIEKTEYSQNTSDRIFTIFLIIGMILILTIGVGIFIIKHKR